MKMQRFKSVKISLWAFLLGLCSLLSIPVILFSCSIISGRSVGFTNAINIIFIGIVTSCSFGFISIIFGVLSARNNKYVLIWVAPLLALLFYGISFALISWIILPLAIHAELISSLDGFISILAILFFLLSVTAIAGWIYTVFKTGTKNEALSNSIEHESNKSDLPH